jgi:hypothetical protein
LHGLTIRQESRLSSSEGTARTSPAQNTSCFPGFSIDLVCAVGFA